MDCCLCKDEIGVQVWTNKEGKIVEWKDGHNAQPLKDGRCCGRCNSTKVVPERMALMRETAILNKIVGEVA